MTEKRFVKGYHTIRDIKENNTYDFQVNIICDLLNELDKKWIDEFSLRETLQQDLQRVEAENQQLKQFHEKVFSLLDKEIIQNEEAIEWGKRIDANSGAMGFYNHMLKKIKKELQE